MLVLTGLTDTFEWEVPMESAGRVGNRPQYRDPPRTGKCGSEIADSATSKERRFEDAPHRLRVNQDTSPDGLVILDAVRDDSGNIVDFVCEYANAAGAYMLRRSVDDLFGHQLLEIIPDSLEFEEYVRALETRQSMDSEIYDSTEGAERWFKRTAVPLTELLLVTYRDITAHKRQERRRRFVVEAASQLSESADTEEILRRLTTVAVLDFADCALAYLINGLGQVRRIGTAHADNSRRHALLEFDRQLPQALRSDIVHSTIRRANVVIQQDIDEQAIADWSRDPGLAAVQIGRAHV